MIDQNSLNGSHRPRSAVVSQHFSSSSFGKFFQQQGVLDENTVAQIWRGFGSYIAKELRNGRGVAVPKFGNFTFSSTLVDLGGTTNPGDRDKQVRQPVFIVGKDFVSAVYIKSGIAHNKGAAVRPFDSKGSNGIIPKVKINYTEVAALCQLNKDTCRNGCEQVFRFLSDKARRGEHTSMDIPFVGTFLLKSGIAAIAFFSELVEDTKGVTAKNHYVNNLFASNGNKHNLQLIDQNINKQNPTVGLGGAIKITNDAESWLKSNLNINMNDLCLNSATEPLQKPSRRLQSAHPLRRQGQEDLRQKSWAINQNQGIRDGMLTEQNKIIFDRMSESKQKLPLPKRPLSAFSRSNQSRMSEVPEVSHLKLTFVANDIYKNRQAITDLQTSSNGHLRDILTSSEIQSLLKGVDLPIEIGLLKALLKELGFAWNGKSCSLMNLFQKCQELSASNETNRQNKAYLPTNVQNSKLTQRPEDFLNKIKDLFYSTSKTMYELFQEGKTGQGIDQEGLKKIIQKYSQSAVSEEQIEQVFKAVTNGAQQLSYQEFEQAFQWKRPTGTDWETRCIREIREWMFKNALSSETSFEMMLAKANKVVQKKLTRLDFHQAIQDIGLRFNAPETDNLFKILDTNQDGELDLDEWQSRIYCDSQNPLQMLREVIQNNNLTSDDLLFKMHIRVWDAPLEYQKFCECLRKIDPSLSESQLRVLAKQIKNKEGKIEIPQLLVNLCGKEFETVDYRNKISRRIYAQVFPRNEKKLLQLLEESDQLNDGKVEPAALKVALAKVTYDIDQETIDRFVRFLDKDTSGKIDYIAFLDRMSEVSNRDHNPFKSVVQRLSYFIQSNGQTVQSLVRRLTAKCGLSYERGVPTDFFAEFLNAKIDKKRSEDELRKYASYMDIDKDGYLSEIDISTCINNLSSDSFFKNSGEALAQSAFSSGKKFFPASQNLSNERAFEIAKQIKAALITQKIAYKEAFNRFDSNKDGFLSFAEFSEGLDKIIQLSQPVKEKFFALMDKNQIGLVDYQNFLAIIQCSAAANIKKNDFSDSFDWENNIVELIKKWVLKEKITIEEAFKCFDRDFDSFVKKDDLKWAIVNILKVKEEEILPTKLDRLFRLMDFYKTGQIQLSDFQRLLNDTNPYSSTGVSSNSFRKSFGGSFAQTSTFDWKLSAIQQIGLMMSKKYESLKQSFDEASEMLQKITFDQFRRFIEKNHSLNGYNMTLPLMQKLFAEIDPHKKGYLTFSDWVNAFQAFKLEDQVLIELKNALQCNFSDCESAFQFFLSFKGVADSKKKTINRNDFEKAVGSLSAGRFTKNDIDEQWKQLSENGKYLSLDKYLFRSHFEYLQYSGFSSLREIKTAPAGARATIVSVSSSSSQWESDILEKLRQIIRSSSKTLEEIFQEFDEDRNGSISQLEFRNAIRKLNLGLSSREIDKILTKVDQNADGRIDWKEFMNKFKTNDLDERLKERAKDRMARFKELMILHMTSPQDAFRFFDESKLGKLTYQEFSKLVLKAYELGGDPLPAYPIIKDLFDAIDIRKDGILDLHEWQQTFGFITQGNTKLTIKMAAPSENPLALWENTREYQRIGTLIARNRKLLRDTFIKQTSGSSEVTFEQAKAVLMPLLQPHFNALSDEKLHLIVKVGELQNAFEAGIGNRFDFERILSVYKNRHAAPQY